MYPNDADITPTYVDPTPFEISFEREIKCFSPFATWETVLTKFGIADHLPDLRILRADGTRITNPISLSDKLISCGSRRLSVDYGGLVGGAPKRQREEESLCKGDIVFFVNKFKLKDIVVPVGAKGKIVYLPNKDKTGFYVEVSYPPGQTTKGRVPQDVLESAGLRRQKSYENSSGDVPIYYSLRVLVEERLGDLVSFTTEALSDGTKLSDAVFEVADKRLKDELAAIIDVDEKIKERFHEMMHYRIDANFMDPALKPINNAIPDDDFFLRNEVDHAVRVVIEEEKERIKDIICNETIETFVSPIFQEPTETAILQYKIAFQLFDKGGDGTISIKDLSTVVRSLGQNVTESMVQILIDEMDAGVNGTIDFPEFCVLMTCRLGHVVSKKNTVAVLRALGGSLAAVRYVMTSLLNDPLSDDEFDAVLTDDFVDLAAGVRSEAAAGEEAMDEEAGEEAMDEEAGEEADEEASEESGEEAGEEAGEAAAPAKGKMYWYMNVGEQIKVEVVQVSYDVVPYGYSIRMPDGSVRETEGDRLVEAEEAGEETTAGELARLKQHTAALKKCNAALKTEIASLEPGDVVATMTVKDIVQTIALDVKYAPKRAAMANHLSSFENVIATPLHGSPLDRANAKYRLDESGVAAADRLVSFKKHFLGSDTVELRKNKQTKSWPYENFSAGDRVMLGQEEVEVKDILKLEDGTSKYVVMNDDTQTAIVSGDELRSPASLSAMQSGAMTIFEKCINAINAHPSPIVSDHKFQSTRCYETKYMTREEMESVYGDAAASIWEKSAPTSYSTSAAVWRTELDAIRDRASLAQRAAEAEKTRLAEVEAASAKQMHTNGLELLGVQTETGIFAKWWNTACTLIAKMSTRETLVFFSKVPEVYKSQFIIYLMKEPGTNTVLIDGSRLSMKSADACVREISLQLYNASENGKYRPNEEAILAFDFAMDACIPDFFFTMAEKLNQLSDISKDNSGKGTVMIPILAGHFKCIVTSNNAPTYAHYSKVAHDRIRVYLVTDKLDLEEPKQHLEFVEQRRAAELQAQEGARVVGARPVSASGNGREDIVHSKASSSAGPASAFTPISPAPVGGALSAFDAFVKEWKKAENTNPVLKQYSYKPIDNNTVEVIREGIACTIPMKGVQPIAKRVGTKWGKQKKK